MSLHRLLGFHTSVPDPGALAAFYAELGLPGDASRGFTGTDGGAAVTVGEGPARRLDSVTVGCDDPADLEATARRLREQGLEVRHGDDVVSVVDPASRVRLEVQVAEPEIRHRHDALVVPNAPGAAVRVDRRAPAVFDGPRPPRRLGHLVIDLHEYDHRDPTVGKVLLLHVNPSKQDCERMVVVAPELAAVFASMARRIRAAVRSSDTALPLLVAYDYGECVDTAPLPFLFQRTAGRGIKGDTRPMNKVYVQRAIDRAVASAGLRTLDGQALRFTPHDFRRIFATDALAAGLPPHIIQQLLGHATLATTQGYAAIFPDDIIRSHRAFIENRRATRPSEEYRDVTESEWQEFEEHFARRKIAIGDCMRAYGTSCVHEYACEQCKLARPDPNARPRLERTRAGLLEQMEEAANRGWQGESERLTFILAAVDDKLDELHRIERRSSLVALPTPRPRVK